jgi:hypothetical protein
MEILWGSAIVGGIAACIVVLAANRATRLLSCPRCGEVLGDRKLPSKTRQQFLWGGWTCPCCGCDVDRNRVERQAPTIGCQELASFLESFLSTKRSVRDIFRRPWLIVTEPQTLVNQPWTLVVVFATVGPLATACLGASEGSVEGLGRAVEGALVGGFVGFVMASFVGIVFACVAWLARAGILHLLRLPGRESRSGNS